MSVLVVSKIMALSSCLMFSLMDLRAESKFENFHEALERVQIMDGPSLDGGKLDKDIIRNHLQDSWREISKSIDEFSSLEQRKIVTSAMDSLEDVDYLEFSVIFLGLLKDGKIDISSGSYLLMPNESKEGFLAVNYKDEKLSLALTEVRELFHHQPDYLKFIDSILNGRANDDFLKFREGVDLKARPPVANRKIISAGTLKKNQDIQSKNNLESSKNSTGKPINTKGLKQKSTSFSLWLLSGSTVLLSLSIMAWLRVRKTKSTS